jgi:hypothetical protein
MYPSDAVSDAEMTDVKVICRLQRFFFDRIHMLDFDMNNVLVTNDRPPPAGQECYHATVDRLSETGH